MDKQVSITERLRKFQSDYQLLAGSRDGYPKIALSLNDVRELLTLIDEKKD